MTGAKVAKKANVPKAPVARGIYYDFDQWGPAVWTHAHCYTFKYPDEPSAQDRDQAIAFFTLLPFTLPCGLCGFHFITMLKEQHPLTDDALRDKTSLTRWLNTVHNTVNRRLGKKEVTYEEAKRLFLTEGPQKPAAPVGRGYKVGFMCAVMLSFVLLAIVIYLVIQQQHQLQDQK